MGRPQKELSSMRAMIRGASARWGLVVLALAIWEASGRLHLVRADVVPTLTESVAAAADMWRRHYLYTHAMVSLCRVMLGLVVGLAAAVPAGWVLGSAAPSAERFLAPLLRLFGQINPYCLFPLFVVAFGAGETPKIAVLAWVSAWPIFFSTLEGFRQVDSAAIKTARSMSAGPWSLFWRVSLPSAAPQIFAGVRVGVSMAFFILIAAEMTGATVGLGWIIHSAGARYQVPRLYGAGLCVVALGVAIARLLAWLHDGLFFWREPLDPAAAPAGGAGAATAAVRRRGIPRRRMALAVAVLVLVLASGVWQIVVAETKLSDPTAIPAYRIWEP
jgi:NitT/TauT family transport system permease protein